MCGTTCVVPHNGFRASALHPLFGYNNRTTAFARATTVSGLEQENGCAVLLVLCRTTAFARATTNSLLALESFTRNGFRASDYQLVVCSAQRLSRERLPTRCLPWKVSCATAFARGTTVGCLFSKQLHFPLSPTSTCEYHLRFDASPNQIRTWPALVTLQKAFHRSLSRC